MKWYFALSAASLDSVPHGWRSLIRVSVLSALRNTGLKPHLIWDGPDHPFVREIRNLGVKVIFHRVPFYKDLAAYKPDPVYLATASGCFLRVEIPILERTDDFVLYTDADVIFLRDPVPLLETVKPRRFAAAPEFTPDDNLNSGVLLLNVRQMRADYPAFSAFIRNNLQLGLDQDMYRNYYAGQYEQLDRMVNWKPYWGVNPQAFVLHWHGIKPADAGQHIADPRYAILPDFEALIARDREGYEHYLGVFEDYLSDYAALPTSETQATESCAVVLVVKDEAHDIAAWLAWYHVLGFDTCIVFDDKSEDGTWEILKNASAWQDIRLHRTIGADGDYEPRQEESYRLAIANYGTEFDWLAFFDADEFLHLAADESVKTFLARFEADAIVVNWCVYGSAGHILKPLAPPVEAFTWHGDETQTIGRHVKSFIRPSRLRDGWMNVHCFDIDPERYVMSNGAPVRWSATAGIIDSDPDWGVAKLMHYQNRSMEHFVERMKKRPALINRPGIWQAGDTNHVQDLRPLDWLPRLKAQMARLATANNRLKFTGAAQGWQADLGAIATLREIRLQNPPGAFSLAVSINGTDWVEICQEEAQGPFVWNGPGAAWARYVRVTAAGGGRAELFGAFS